MSGTGALSDANHHQESDLAAEVRAVSRRLGRRVPWYPNQQDLMLLLLLLQFGLLAQLPVQLAAVNEHGVLKTAAEALISVFPAAQYVRCVQQVAGLKSKCCLLQCCLSPPKHC
jgi:hypothetical protein